MTDREKLEKTLRDLEKTTGLVLRVEEQPDTDLGEAAEKAGQLLSAYRERYSRSYFLRALLTGDGEAADLPKMAARYHVPFEEERVIYAVDIDGGNGEAVQAVLKGMFLERRHDFVEMLSPERFAVIRTRKGEEDPHVTARTIVDMLGAEALTRARAGFGRPVTKLTEFRRAYAEASLAVEIGRVFYSEQRVISYGKLGIGRLIHQLPEEPCRLFLSETFGSFDPASFDEETALTIRTFFETNLNISETARKLYLHRNTLVYRLEKLHQQTGLDLRSFEEAMSFRMAMMVYDYLKDRERERA